MDLLSMALRFDKCPRRNIDNKSSMGLLVFFLKLVMDIYAGIYLWISSVLPQAFNTYLERNISNKCSMDLLVHFLKL